MRLSISKKLVALIATSIGLIVATLTIYLSTRQIAQAKHELARKAEVYGQLAASQLQSAIAFGDRQTAREVLESLEADADVTSAAVYASDGSTLYATGVVSHQPVPSAATKQVTRQGRSVWVVAPIATKEGPSGVVSLELSSAGARALQREIAITSAIVGVGMLALGVVAAWLIARSFARRLRRLAAASSAIAAGELHHPPLRDHSSDEVGEVARAFNEMAVQLAASNAELEGRVAERTRELQGANSTLKREMEERARVELELRQAQKLESVGRLAAGVAHELNTPIQYVNDSCAFIRDGVVDLIAVVAAARECCPIGEGAPTAFAEACEARDVEYLAANLEPAIQRAVDGLDRMAKIVRSMKEFSHPDQSNKLESDINRGLLATIEIARNEYKHVADVKTELGELPLVWCHIGELNQAFLNIIVNAAHAIGDVVAAGGERGSIAVRTWCDGDDVKIRITDTGGGIPETVREHIFDPFFTTKEVGKGTGQGLAIVRAVVVDKHGGAIDLATDVGKGTTFTLTVPVRSVEAPVAVAA